MNDRLIRGAFSLAALDDENRRRMYLFIRHQGRPVSREEVAKELGLSRKLAAFHLDKLSEKGLLKFHYARPPGRSGPGAGRPAKVYEPSEARIEVSLPERRYDLAGTLLVDAVLSQSVGDGRQQAVRVSSEAGTRLGREIREARRLRPPGAERTLSVTREILEEYGYEPYEDFPQQMALRNCPFHALSAYAPELICPMNQAFIEGVVRGLGNETVMVDRDPTPGQCCVRLRSPKVSEASGGRKGADPGSPRHRSPSGR
jgi:predicted ArsR family transcriptional regulator